MSDTVLETIFRLLLAEMSQLNLFVVLKNFFGTKNYSTYEAFIKWKTCTRLVPLFVKIYFFL